MFTVFSLPPNLTTSLSYLWITNPFHILMTKYKPKEYFVSMRPKINEQLYGRKYATPNVSPVAQNRNWATALMPWHQIEIKINMKLSY